MPRRIRLCCSLLLLIAAVSLQAGPARSGDANPKGAVAPKPPPPPLYQEDFEAAANGLPQGWLPFGGQWATAGDETTVLQQSQASFRGQARVVLQEANYQVEATARALNCSGQWGVGLIAYWQPGAGCYRLSNFGNVLAIWRERGGQAEPLAAVRMEVKPQAYKLRLLVRNEGALASLRGKMWALGEPEPEGWTISGEDAAEPLRYGRAGAFTGRASAIFTDFTVNRLAAGATAAGAPSDAAVDKPPTPNHWLTIGGDWQVQPEALRQNAAGSTAGFRSSAYAIAAGWTDYTVQVSVRAAAGGRNQGFGLSAYWLDDSDHYELGQLNGNTLALVRRMEGCDPNFLSTTALAFRKGLWYTLKLRLQTAGDGVRLQAKAWPARAGEPAAWQLEAEDLARPRLSGGEVGLWAIDDVCSFDEVQVTSNQ